MARPRNGLTTLVRASGGSVAAIAAVALPVIVGFIGLGVDLGIWYVERRSLQTDADAAAFGAAIHYAGGGNDFAAVALAEAQRNGFGGSPSDITVNHPPATGPNVGNAKAVEVIVRQPAELIFSQYFLGAFEIKARSVAAAGRTGEFCVVGLERTASKAVELSGGANATLGCGVAVNSQNPSALYMAGNSSLDASPISISGSYQLGSNTAITSAPESNMPPVEDPYDDLVAPAPGACDHINADINGGTISPGVYCNGLTLKGTVQLDPGVYVIDGGGMSVNAGAIVTGAGVTIILTDTSLSSNGWGTVDINGSASVTLAAPSTGPWAGVVFFQDRNAPTTDVNKFNGGANLQLTGVLYFPSQELQFTGGSAVGGAVCTHLVARTVNFGGNAIVKNDCDTTGTRHLGRLKPTLIE